MGCYDLCPGQECKKYSKHITNYRNCENCKLQNPSKCWDSKKQKCVSCSTEEVRRTDCTKKYGGKNPNGFPHRDTLPLNPKYTGCKMIE